MGLVDALKEEIGFGSGLCGAGAGRRVTMRRVCTESERASQFEYREGVVWWCSWQRGEHGTCAGHLKMGGHEDGS